MDSFLWLINIPLYLYIYHILFIHSSVNGHLGCFHVLPIVNSAAVNIGVRVSFWIRVFIFSGYMSGSGIAGSYGNSIFSFLQAEYLKKYIYIYFKNIHTHKCCRSINFYKEIIKRQLNIKKGANKSNSSFIIEDVQMAMDHMKRCSILLVVREMQIKTTRLRYHSPPLEWPKFKKTDNTKCWWKCRTTLLHCWWEREMLESL